MTLFGLFQQSPSLLTRSVPRASGFVQTAHPFSLFFSNAIQFWTRVNGEAPEELRSSHNDSAAIRGCIVQDSRSARQLHRIDAESCLLACCVPINDFGSH